MSSLHVYLFQQLLQINHYQDPHIIREAAVSLNLNVEINRRVMLVSLCLSWNTEGNAYL